MHSLFTPVETLDGSTFLRSVHSADGTTIRENFIMPVNGFTNSNGDPVTIAGYGKTYSLFLTIDAQIANGQFLSLNATLWADPLSNDGSVSVSRDKDPAFSNGMHQDIILAIGKMTPGGAVVHPPDSSGNRGADFSETMTPTLEGDILLHGSIQDGTVMTEHLTTPSSTFSTTVVNGQAIDNVNGGSVEVTLNSGNFLLPNVPSAVFGSDHLHFIHHC